MPDSLTLETLRNAVAGSAAAFRCVTEYQPAGGPGDKVFPPTYEGGKYATEKRYVPHPQHPRDPSRARVAECVLLDSVQSQANRMEEALRDAWDEGKIELPVVVVNFQSKGDRKLEKTLRVTSLDAPHRIADAILRDSYDGQQLFRLGERGKRLDAIDLRNATALLELCPTALVFGMWDSTGPKGGLGAKFARALVSEIVGYDAVAGVKTSSRLDPLMVRNDKDGSTTIYKANTPLGWTLNPDEAVRKKDSKGKETNEPLKVGDGKPSEINHGNVVPSLNIQKDRNGNPIEVRPADATPIVMVLDGRPRTHLIAMNEEKREVPIGGFTIASAIQTTTVSLPALRRLHFPVKPGETAILEANIAARTALAALALCAATLARESGCDLRSRCLLVPSEGETFAWELIGAGDIKTFTLSGGAAIRLLSEAVAALRKEITTAWPKDRISLTPSDELLELVVRSQRLATASGGDAGDKGN